MAFTYPTNRELQEIGPVKVARAAANRAGFDILPLVESNFAQVQWKQKDNYFGLQQLRGLDGRPQSVARVGANLYSYNPGVYGEYETISETELTLRAGSITQDVPINVQDLVMEAQDQLIGRELDRQEMIIWTLLTTGTFSVSAPAQSGGNAVVFTDTFTVQTYTRIADWDAAGTAVPLADFRAIALLGAGKGLNFGGQAKAYMNRITANKLLSNTTTSDIGGKRVVAGNTVNSVGDINKLLIGEDVPQVQIYDEGYYDDTNTFVRFIPTDTVVVVGARSNGERVGEYKLTRNANNPGMAPGSYEYVIDRINPRNGEKRTPPTIEIHRGHNGGPVLYHPGAIIVASV